MQKIVPHLWFDKEAKQAAEFYASIFPDSKVTNVTTISGTPSGDADIVNFVVCGYEFMAISAGPMFKINPSVSFFVNFDPTSDPEAKSNMSEIWAKLSVDGKELMPLDKYPFSEWYGWIQDKYGVTWQLMLTSTAITSGQEIMPSMLFVGDVCGKALEASDYYLSVFKDSKRGTISYYPVEMESEKKGNVMYTDFVLSSQWFAAMDSSANHQFAFNEAVSFIVNCETQEEVDYYWEKLSAVPEAEQCGWLKDRFGVSWQIIPTAMGELMSKGTKEQMDRVTQAFLKMKKFDIAKLEEAYRG